MTNIIRFDLNEKNPAFQFFDENKKIIIFGRDYASIWSLETKEQLNKINYKYISQYITPANVDFGFLFINTKKELIIVDKKNFKKVGALTGHKENISSVALSPDEKTLATCAADHNIRLWDVQTRELRTILTYPKNKKLTKGPIREVYFSHDGQLLLSTAHESFEFPTVIWELTSEKEIFKTHKAIDGHYCNDGIFSKDKTQVLLYYGDNKSFLEWYNLDLKTFEIIKVRKSYVVYAISPLGSFLITKKPDHTCFELKDIETDQTIKTFGPFENEISRIQFSKDEKMLGAFVHSNFHFWQLS